MKNKGFTFLGILLLAAIVLLNASCRDEVVEEPIVYNDKIDGIAVSALPPLEESMANSDAVPSYRNTAAFEGSLTTPSTSFDAAGDGFAGESPSAEVTGRSSDPNFN
jgi:hypothetical protein